MRELGIGKEKCNLLGGGVSIGHPIGCTGTRLVYSLAMQLNKSGKKRGLASLCIGGGQGFSMVLESDNIDVRSISEWGSGSNASPSY